MAKINSGPYSGIGRYDKHKLRISLLEHKNDATVWRLYRKYKWRHERICRAITTIQDFGVVSSEITMSDLHEKGAKYRDYMYQIREYMTIRTGRIILEKRKILIEKCKPSGVALTGVREVRDLHPGQNKGANQKKWWLRWFDAIRPRKN